MRLTANAFRDKKPAQHSMRMKTRMMCQESARSNELARHSSIDESSHERPTRAPHTCECVERAHGASDRQIHCVEIILFVGEVHVAHSPPSIESQTTLSSAILLYARYQALLYSRFPITPVWMGPIRPLIVSEIEISSGKNGRSCHTIIYLLI